MSKRRLLKLSEHALSKRNTLHVLSIVLFIIYTAFVVWLTLVKREPRTTERVFKPQLFWAFRLWMTGYAQGKIESIQYIENVLFFIPFGFLFPWKRWKSVLIASLLTSIAIEVTQYIFNLGWCELDDVISNTAGALIGFGAFMLIRKIYRKLRGESRV